MLIQVQIEWRDEIGINSLVITLVTMRKLSLANQLDGIIPVSYTHLEHEPQSMRAREIYISEASNRLKIISKVSF